MAQNFAGMKSVENLKRRHWQRFAADVGLYAPGIIALFEDLYKGTLAESKNVAAEVAAMPAGAHPLMQQVTEAIEGRARAVLAGLEDRAAADDAPPAAPAGGAPRKRAKSARSS
jgi:serine/threonine-protein kinase HipA